MRNQEIFFLEKLNDFVKKEQKKMEAVCVDYTFI
jgi:hypothetical protein